MKAFGWQNKHASHTVPTKKEKDAPNPVDTWLSSQGIVSVQTS